MLKPHDYGSLLNLASYLSPPHGDQVDDYKMNTHGMEDAKTASGKMPYNYQL